MHRLKAVHLDSSSSPQSAPPLPDLITLAEATRLAPGRPNTSTIWRWCRRGVLARNGTRVRLKHRRMGSRVFTAASWLAEFGDALAAADAEYFATPEQGNGRNEPRPSAPGPQQRADSRMHPQMEVRANTVDLAAIEAELDSEGL